jgi:hypothetical protein
MFNERESPPAPDFRVAPFLGFEREKSFFSTVLSFRIRVSVLFLHEMHETRHIDSAVTIKNRIKNMSCRFCKKGYSGKGIAQIFKLFIMNNYSLSNS